MVAPGSIIDCERHELGNLVNLYEQLDPDEPEPELECGLIAVRVKHGQWNVINESSGKPINSEPLTKAEAKQLISKGLEGFETEHDEAPKEEPNTDIEHTSEANDGAGEALGGA